MCAPRDLSWLHPELDRCRVLIDQQRRELQIWTKVSSRERDETVTSIDLAVERLLVDAISRRYPSAAVVAEETRSDHAALSAPICFVIDPIDGTDELVAGREGYAISVALYVNDQPMAAIVDMPAKSRRFECHPETGTTMNGSLVELRDRVSVRSAHLAISATQYRMDSLRSFWHDLGAASLSPTPAFAAKFGAVLAGDADAALYLPVRPLETAIWDYAAPAMLLARAGGHFMTTDGVDLLSQRPPSYQGGWIASPPTLSRKLLEAVRLLPRDT